MNLDIRYTNDFDEACNLRDQGYEPIECAFGQHGSVLGPLALDHHGTESAREGVALRACRDFYAARQSDPRFVVTGTPDADATLAIIALAGLVPISRISKTFYELVDLNDVDPIGTDLLETPEGIELSWFNQQEMLFQNEAGFRKAVTLMSNLLQSGLTSEERDHVVRSDQARRRAALEGILSLRGRDGADLSIPKQVPEILLRGQNTTASDGRVLVVKSAVWGFDQWYRFAPCVVSYASRMAKITVGCADKETAQILFGPKGLSEVWPFLGHGWGGRESIGGSPRGERKNLHEAYETAGILIAHVLA